MVSVVFGSDFFWRYPVMNLIIVSCRDVFFCSRNKGVPMGTPMGHSLGYSWATLWAHNLAHKKPGRTWQQDWQQAIRQGTLDEHHYEHPTLHDLVSMVIAKAKWSTWGTHLVSLLQNAREWMQVHMCAHCWIFFQPVLLSEQPPHKGYSEAVYRKFQEVPLKSLPSH